MFVARSFEHNKLRSEQLEYLNITIGKGDSSYKLKFPTGIKAFQKTWSQYVQDIEIDRLLKQKRNGFFVEIGGYDGLLIEANPYIYEKLVEKNRACYTVNCCVSANMSNMTFILADVYTGAAKLMRDTHRNFIKELGYKRGGVQHGENVQRKSIIKFMKSVQYDHVNLLGAIGMWRIDFFSLDVEGAELHILKSINLDKVYIDDFFIETNKSDLRRKSIIEFMERVNYDHVSKLKNGDIFRKRQYCMEYAQC
ncbi:hypothetical protein MAR_006427 [Mya arenaria]|uniref:Methyltransferase FkbM domain-containing protein n=1 Tax=Mya arenaria TaxID=6604 RepID=A0ABY7DA41_MYAAR|nr:hypothetical protein MAR_006427 [Mya arenaria]